MKNILHTAQVLCVIALGALLILPSIGSFGLWDPQETHDADAARELIEPTEAPSSALERLQQNPPPLYLWTVATGFELLGVSELGARLPLALLGLLGLLLAYRIGTRLASHRAGLTSAFVLATMPAYLFQSRQVNSDIVYYVALLAALGGLAAYIAPASRRASWVDLLIGALGLLAGFFSKGLMLGAVFPLAVLLLSIAVACAIGTDRAHYRQALRERGLLLAGGVLASAAVIAYALERVGTQSLWIWGAVPHQLVAPPTFEEALRDLGYGTFPWFALAPLAIGAFAWTLTRNETEPVSSADNAAMPPLFAQIVMVLVIVCAYALSSLWPSYLAPLRFPALPWIALCVGTWLAWALQQPRGKPFWALAAAILVLVLSQDFFMQPGTLAFSFLLQQPPYPLELKIKLWTRLFGIGLAVLFFFSLLDPPALPERRRDATGATPSRGAWARCWRLLQRIGNQLVYGVTWFVATVAPRAWVASAVAIVLFAGWCTHYLTPALSHHMSNKALFESYHLCKRDDERLAQYHVAGRGAAYYNNGQVDLIKSQTELFKKLRETQRLFVIIPATDLGTLDRAARQQHVDYYTLDDRSSRYLLISNQLGGVCATDVNPLRRLVVKQRPTPQHEVKANFEHRVELIGYDCPTEVRAGGKLHIKLYFHVLGPVPPGYKLFIHFDTPSNRFHGDHDPLQGKYPTQYWLPGDYIIDPHDVDLPLLTTERGRYTIWMGFWQGQKRLKVVSGPNDGSNRVRLGTVRVKL